MEHLRIVKLSERAIAPYRATPGAAGYDLHSAYDYEVLPGEKCLCDTQVQIGLPPGCYARIAPRSGLASNFFIDVGAGVVDSDYNGSVKVLLFNFSKEKFVVTRGERIAQLILERICTPEVVICDKLEKTERGSGSFGSTGK